MLNGSGGDGNDVLRCPDIHMSSPTTGWNISWSRFGVSVQHKARLLPRTQPAQFSVDTWELCSEFLLYSI
jgi:hypothetical protein